MDGTNIMGQSYAMSIQGAEHLIDKAYILADAAERAHDEYVRRVFDRDSSILYERAWAIKKEARNQEVPNPERHV